MIEINGPGKYDDLCTLVMQRARARGCFVIVIDGNRGSGFSGQLTPALAASGNLAAMLRNMADQLDGKA